MSCKNRLKHVKKILFACQTMRSKWNECIPELHSGSRHLPLGDQLCLALCHRLGLHWPSLAPWLIAKSSFAEAHIIYKATSFQTFSWHKQNHRVLRSRKLQSTLPQIQTQSGAGCPRDAWWLVTLWRFFFSIQLESPIQSHGAQQKAGCFSICRWQPQQLTKKKTRFLVSTSSTTRFTRCCWSSSDLSKDQSIRPTHCDGSTVDHHRTT